MYSKAGQSQIWACQSEWVATVECNACLFEGLAHVHAATVAGEAGREYGLQVAHLREALIQLGDAQQLCERRAPSYMRPPIDAARALAETAHANAVKDNELIYHEPVPSSEALPSCKRAPKRMVKPQLPPEVERALAMAAEMGASMGVLQGWP